MINVGLLLSKVVTARNIIYVINVRGVNVGRHIRKKAFKTEAEALKFSKKLGLDIGTNNIKFWPIKSSAKQGKGYTMYSFNNMDAKSHQGKPNLKPPTRLALLFQDKDHKPQKPWQFLDPKYNYNKLPVGINKCV